MAVSFHNAPSANFPKKAVLRQAISQTAAQHKHKIGELNYVFVTDEELLQMNRQYLNHDYFTDIITFDNSEIENQIDGDVFISIDRVVDNGSAFGCGPKEEFIRVIAHGLLHLLGHKDKKPAEALRMRGAEDLFMEVYKKLNH